MNDCEKTIFAFTDRPTENYFKDLDKHIDDITTKETKIRTGWKWLDERLDGGFLENGRAMYVFAGPTNVGKSSLLNYLSKKDVAIVSEIAGTTRDVIETHLNLDGYPVIISDTAGIRDSKNEIEKKGIKLALRKAEEADLRLVVIEPKNLHFTGFLKDLFDENSILVINKSDLKKIELNNQLKKINHVLISIKKNKNLDELILKIKNELKSKFLISDEILITRERHRQHLKETLNCIKNFNKKNLSEDFDKAAEDLRLATRHLGMIVGKVDVEEILGSIFNDFCIGK